MRFILQNSLSSLNQKGYVALVALIIIATVVLFIGVSVSLSGISELQMGFAGNQSTKAFNFAEACIESSLEKLRINWKDNESSLKFDDGACRVKTQVSGNSATIISSGQVDNYTRVVQAEIDSSLKVISWRELSD